MRQLYITLVSFILLMPGRIEGGTFSDSSAHPHLIKAHESYMNGDLYTMALSIKKLLQDPEADLYLRSNAMDLLNRVMNLIKPRALPVDWRLPPKIRDLELVTRVDQKLEGVDYSVILQGSSLKGSRPLQISLKRSSGEVILDLNHHIGEMDHSRGTHPGSDNFRIFRSLEQRLPHGLYSLNIKLASGEDISAWFVITPGQKRQDPKSLVRRLKESRSQAKNKVSYFKMSTIFPDGTTVVKREELYLQGDDSKSEKDRKKSYQRAFEKKILEMNQRKSSDEEVVSESEEILRLNQKEVHRFGELTVRKELSTEVSME